MTKDHALTLILARLEQDLDLASRAAQAAHEAATHEESVAENKYDTRGLEASYLAAGQARRVEELRLALQRYRALRLRPFDAARGIELSALVRLSDDRGGEQTLFLGPDAAGLRIADESGSFMVITPHSPLGQRLLGRDAGDEIELQLGAACQRYQVLDVA